MLRNRKTGELQNSSYSICNAAINKRAFSSELTVVLAHHNGHYGHQITDGFLYDPVLHEEEIAAVEQLSLSVLTSNEVC